MYVSRIWRNSSYTNCVCIQAEQWEGCGEKEACLRGRLNKGRLSHSLTSAAQSLSTSGHSQRAHGDGSTWGDWNSLPEMALLMKRAAAWISDVPKSAGNLLRLWAALPISELVGTVLHFILFYFFQTHGINKRKNACFAPKQRKGFILRQCRRDGGLCCALNEAVSYQGSSPLQNISQFCDFLVWIVATSLLSFLAEHFLSLHTPQPSDSRWRRALVSNPRAGA